MNVTQKIKMDLISKQNIQTIHAVRDDTNSRCIEISLFDGGVPWRVPLNCKVAIAYLADNGANGIYDTLPNGEDAYIYDENKITFTLIPAALHSGTTKVTVVISDENGNQISTFPLNVDVAENYSYGASKPETYINLRQWLSEELSETVGDFFVEVFPAGDGYASDDTIENIEVAQKSARTIYCILETEEQEHIYLPMTKKKNGGFYFSAVCDGVERLVKLTGENDDGNPTVAVKSTTLPYEMRVVVIKHEDGTCSADTKLSDIYKAHTGKIPVVCHLVIPGIASPIRLPLGSLGEGVAVFSGIYEGHIYTVTITADSVTVEVDTNAVSGVVLKDQVDGETYTLYMEDADLHIVAGGKATAARDHILLEDQSGGDNYVIYVSNGEPMLEREV